MSTWRIPTWGIAIAALVAMASLCICGVLVGIMGSVLSMQSYGSEAIYKDMLFGVGESGEYSSFFTDVDEGGIAKVYVRRPESRVVFDLPNLTERQLIELWPTADDGDIDGETVYSRGGNLGSAFGFRNGTLTSCRLSDIAGLEISPSRNGEFISLPAKQKDVHRLFGKPNRYRSYKRART